MMVVANFSQRLLCRSRPSLMAKLIESKLDVNSLPLSSADLTNLPEDRFMLGLGTDVEMLAVYLTT
jgi:hypothetical protein